MATPDFLSPTDTFIHRHLGPTDADAREMLATLGLQSLEELSEATVPADIRMRKELDLPLHRGEHAVLEEIRSIAAENQIYRSLIGMGYYDCLTPGVIQRNIFENPSWYTQYTPYQAEISQGRLEALVNFQTLVTDLTGLPLANASLLDEATAAAEAMAMCPRRFPFVRPRTDRVLRLARLSPQTIAVMQTRAEPLGMTLRVGRTQTIDFSNPQLAGILLQYPATDGYVGDYSALVAQAHAAGVLVGVATDLLALTLLRSPGEFGADIAVGSSQRFGVPLGLAAPTPRFFRPLRHSNGRCRDASSECPRMSRENLPTGFPCKPANNTFGVKRPRATFVRRRCSWPSWRVCTRSTTGRRACGELPSACTA